MLLYQLLAVSLDEEQFETDSEGASEQTRELMRQERAETVTQLTTLLPADPNDMEIHRCEADIDADLAEQILEVWETMLLQSRYSRQGGELFVTDGESYHFSMFGREHFGWLAAQTWFPIGDQNAPRLVRIGYTMNSFCNSHDQTVLIDLGNQVDELRAILAVSPE